MFLLLRGAPSVSDGVFEACSVPSSASHRDTAGGTLVSSDVWRTNTELTVRATLHTGGRSRELLFQLLPPDYGSFLPLIFLSPYARFNPVEP